MRQDEVLRVLYWKRRQMAESVLHHTKVRSPLVVAQLTTWGPGSIENGRCFSVEQQMAKQKRVQTDHMGLKGWV